MSELPDAFQDAIKVSRCLGVQYLWIDALCIIQDSDADKVMEIATMDEVYHNALVTICGANVDSFSQSFLATWVPRSYPDPFRLAKIQFPCPNGDMGNIFAEAGSGYSSSKEPLGQRGWALQERLVSPRVLTFGHHQMYWHCQSAQHSEGGGYKDDFSGPGSRLDRLGHGFFKQKGDCHMSTDHHEIYHNWRTIVEDYRKRRLTVRADVLPALSGIATRFANILNDTYCAGLWKNDLLNCLAWHSAVEPNSNTSRPSEYRAPTWSWASIDSPTYWWPRGEKATVDIVMSTKVVNCDVEPVCPIAPYGKVQAGRIELRGPLRDVDWDGGEGIEDADGASLATAMPDATMETLDISVDGEVAKPIVFHMGVDQEGVNAVTRRVSCVPLKGRFSLILERQLDGEYVRLGLAHLDYPNDDDKLWRRDFERLYKGCSERTIIIR
jgi:Heterokaryon incompatibility protein (HET)